jgi:adenylate cyclase
LATVSPRFEEWLAAERARLVATMGVLLRRLATAHRQAGDHDSAIAAATRLVGLDELREDSHRLLIETLAAAGRRAEALRAFETCRAILKRELGVVPDPETSALVRLISTEATTPLRPAPDRPGKPRPDRPSIAVLPFQNVSSDPEQEHVADGIVEEITTALSRIRWLNVGARNSSFVYKGRPVDAQRVGRELGARYLLEGSVRRAGARLRVAIQLIEAESNAHLWASRFDGSLDDLFALQDTVAASVAGALEPILRAAELRRSAGRPDDELTAYDLHLRALARLYDWDARAGAAALELIECAIARDPGYGPAVALGAMCHYAHHLNGWSADPAASRQTGIDLARRALRVCDDDPEIIANAACALGYFGEDIDAAIGLIDRALVLNPNLAIGWVRSGWLRLWAAHPDAAISHFTTSLRLASGSNQASARMGIGVGHFFARRFADAGTALASELQAHPGSAPLHRFLAASYAHLGRLDEARETMRRLRQITSVLLPNMAHWRDPQQRALLLTGLRLAAGEKGG